MQASINGGGAYPDGIIAQLNTAGTMLTFLETGTNADLPTITNNGALTDTTPASSTTTIIAPSTNLGTLTVGNSTDLLTGVLNGVGKNGSTPFQISLTGWTLAQLAATINNDASYGITATLNQQGTALTFTATPGDPARPPSETMEASPLHCRPPHLHQLDRYANNRPSRLHHAGFSHNIEHGYAQR